MAGMCCLTNIERTTGTRLLPWRHRHHKLLHCLAGTNIDLQKYNNNHIVRCHRGLLPAQHSVPASFLTQRRHFYIHQVAVDVVKLGLLELHSVTGLHWWATIVLVAVPVRVGMSVLVQYLSRRNTLKMIEVQKACAEYGKQLAKEMSQSRRQLETMNITTKDQYDYLFKKKMQEFEKRAYEKAKSHPRKMFLYNFIPLPLWLALSLALRSMSGGGVWKYISASSCPSMATEGCLWFPDLLAADPFHVLPIATCALFMLTFEIAALTPIPQNHPHRRIFRVFDVAGRTWTCVMLYLFWNLPSAITWYWTLSAATATYMNIALRSSRVRKVFGVPDLPYDSVTPYRDLVIQAQRRYGITKQQASANRDKPHDSEKDRSSSGKQD